MIKNLSESEIWNLIDAAHHAHLGCHANGRTYVVPISYARDGDRLVGLTSAGLKIEMMRANPEVCLQVEEVQSLTQWRSAILHGRFQELTGSARSIATGLMIDKYGQGIAGDDADGRRGRDVTPPRLDGKPEPFIVYEIRITEFSGRVEEP